MSSVVSIPLWGGCSSQSVSHIGQMIPLHFVYLTVMECGSELRMTSSYNLLQSIELLILLVAIGTRLNQRSRVACRNSTETTTGSLILWINCVTFLGSPFLRSSHMIRNDVDVADSVRPIHYSTSDRRVSCAPALSPRSSLTHAHRCIGPRNATSPLATSVRLIYLSVSHGRDSACEPVPSPSPRSSLTHAHTGASVHATQPAHRLPRRD
jgi:hypothetical protein